MMTIKQLQTEIEQILTKAGVDSPAFDSLCLVENVWGVNHSSLISMYNQEATKDKIQALFELAQERASGKPLQYILGSWEFYGYKFNVGEGVLIPRDDTEVVLSFALDYLKDKPNAKVLDLCSGSGALAVVIQKETGAQVTAVEKSSQALPYLYENIEINHANVNVVEGDIFTCMDEFEDNYFDLIISNPPYIKTDDIKELQKEVQFEPSMALDGGNDGYDFYNHIIKYWTPKLKPQGELTFELGEGQYDTVKSLMEIENFRNIQAKLDLGNTQRAIKGTLFEK